MAQTKSIQRTIKYLVEKLDVPRNDIEIVEKFNPYAGPHGQRKDLFGIIDILYFDQDDNLIAIQACGSDYAGHIDKINESYYIKKWLKSGNKFHLLGWRKLLKERGGKAKVWTPRVKIYEIDDFK